MKIIVKKVIVSTYSIINTRCKEKRRVCNVSLSHNQMIENEHCLTYDIAYVCFSELLISFAQ